MKFLKNDILKNSAWMIAEKGVNVLGLFFVNSYMAKYIGPESYGKISFVGSLFLFIQTFAWFGAQNVLFKRMSENKNSGITLAINTQMQRKSIFALSSVLVMLYLYFYSDTLTFIFGVTYCAATYFIISDFFSVYNNSQLKSQVNTISNVIGLMIALGIRYVITRCELSIYLLSIPIVIISALPYMIRVIYFKQEDVLFVTRKKKQYNKYLFTTGGALLFSTLSITIYTQISNLLLAKLVSYESLGIYTAALTLGGAWGVLSQAIITSFFSKIYAEKNEIAALHILRKLNRIIVFLSLSFLIFIEVFGRDLILFLYGSSYIESLKLIPIIIVGTMFSSLGTICYRYMIKLGAYKYLSIKMVIVSLVSIPISYFFIFYYGVLGAAFCFLLLEFLSCTFGNYFYDNKIMVKIHMDIFTFKK